MEPDFPWEDPSIEPFTSSSPYRDLAEEDVWERSLRRSRERRAAAESRGIELPARKLSVAALVALTGGPVVGVAVGKALGGDDGQDQATAAAPAVYRQAGQRAAMRPPSRNTNATRSEPARIHTRPAAPAATSRFSPHRPGGGVVELQRALNVPVDGTFGPRTEHALERWQKRHGFEADGVAGPATREALDLGAGRVLRRAQPRHARRHRVRHGHAATRHEGGVAALQGAIGVSPDGVFGPGTERALKRWQRRHGLTADGVAGPQTRRRLGLGSGPVLKRRHHALRHRHHRRRHGGGGSVVQRVIAAANAIATAPYKYGGGHGSFRDSGYDCSGSVSYALHGGGLLSSPLDSSALMSYGRPGPGRHITIYANPGHVFMTINGRRFDTSARSQTGSRWGGPRSGSGYVVRHPAGL